MVKDRGTWYREIGARVRSERERQGLTLGELAGRTGMGEHYLRLMEQGKRTISIDGMFSVCTALNVSMDKMSGLNEKSPKDER